MFLIQIIYWKHQTNNFWQNLILNYQILIKAYINMPYKTNKSFLAFLKNISPEKRKKKTFFFGKWWFESKIWFTVEKKANKFWGNFKITWKKFCCRHQKKKLVIQLPCMEMVWWAFFLTKSFSSTIQRNLCQNKGKFLWISMTPF